MFMQQPQKYVIIREWVTIHACTKLYTKKHDIQETTIVVCRYQHQGSQRTHTDKRHFESTLSRFG